MKRPVFEHKFKIGDILKHKSEDGFMVTRMLVIGTGHILYSDHISNVVDCHFIKKYDDHGILGGGMFDENELEKLEK